MNPLYHTQPGPPSWNNYNAVYYIVIQTRLSQALIFEMDNVMKPKYLLGQDDDSNDQRNETQGVQLFIVKFIGSMCGRITLTSLLTNTIHTCKII